MEWLGVVWLAVLYEDEKEPRMQEAMRVFEAMERAGVPADTITYNALITACRNAGDPGAANRFASLMSPAGRPC